MPVTLPATGEVVATEEISTAEYQLMKLVDGTAGSTTPIAAGAGAEANAMRTVEATDSALAVAVAAIQTAAEAIQAIAETVISTESITDLNGSTVSAQEAQRMGLGLITGPNTYVDVSDTNPIPVSLPAGGTSGVQYTVGDAADPTPTGTIAMGVNASNEPKTLLFDASGNVLVAFATAMELTGDVTITADVEVPQVTPTVSNGAAYTAGDQVGGLMTFSNALRETGRGAVDYNVSLLDKSNQKAPMTLLCFSALPTAVANNAAFAWTAADAPKWIGKVNITAADYETVGAYALATVPASFAVYGNGTANLYAIAITTGTPTYTATDALIWSLGLLRD